MKTKEKHNPSPSNLPKVGFFELIPKTNIDFISEGIYCYAISGLLALGTIILLVVRGGLPLGIDFTGGISVQFAVLGQAAINDVRSAFNREGLDAEVQSLGTPGEFMARFKKEEEDRGLDGRLEKAMKSLDQTGVFRIISKDFVGAAVGAKLSEEAMMAVGLAFLGIIIYVGFRFRNLIWGAAGVVAIIHDVFLAVGFLLALGLEFDLVMVASLMTLAGYSINDTIVIFDRLRERMRVYPKESLRDAINKAVNETLSRTLITAGLVFLSCVALVLLGGDKLRPFSTVLLFGVVTGSYSTVFIAIRLVYSWANLTGLRVR
ncbi:MAG: protein translocase subunit SecF [Elusimicrobia bacterium]|nr:protein translocase subunit SecF [Elusimicrobiota bacterium]